MKHLIFLTLFCFGFVVLQAQKTPSVYNPASVRIHSDVIKAVRMNPWTGVFQCNDGGIYYLRQEGNKLYWYGENREATFANVLDGDIAGNIVTAQWIDVPKGGATGKGNLKLTLDADNNKITKSADSGSGFGGTTWTRLATAPAYAASKPATKGGSSYNGIWSGNDGGVYYTRLEGNVFVWYGEAVAAAGQKPGFANIFIGKNNNNVVTGQWFDVPKGNATGSGTMTLNLESTTKITRTQVTGGFGGSMWTRVAGATPVIEYRPTSTMLYTSKMAERAGVILGTPKPGGTTTTPTPTTPAPKPEELVRQGPNNLPLEPLKLIKSDYAFPASYKQINVYNQIFRDANHKSGYFYYLPAAYNLDWKPETGYVFHVKYLASGTSGKGEATVTAQLSPGLTTKDLELTSALILADLKNDPMNYFTDLLSVPLAGPPTVSINQITSFGIKPEDISITTSSDLKEPVSISWKMSNVENLMTAMFDNVGLSGNIFFQLEGEGMPKVGVPFNIKFNDPNTFGRFELDPATWRNGWTNNTPYPVVIKNIHVMRTTISSDRAFSVYTWNAGDKTIPPGSKANFNPNTIPGWVDSHSSIQRIWVEYGIAPCQYCDDVIENNIVGGAKGTRNRNITFDVIDAMDYSKASMIKLKIRSIQADPNGRSKIDLPTLTIKKDDATLDGGTLYIPEGGRPEFEYLLQLIMPDGTVHESTSWQLSTDTDTNIIGQALLRKLFPTLKTP